MDRRPRRGAWVALFLGAGFLAASPSAHADPFHLQIDNSILANPDPVQADRWVAQSFVPSTPFTVSRVSLRVSDVDPSDILSVSIRESNVLAFPAGTNVTSGSADGTVTPSWLDFDLAPYVPLVANRSYWIVAHSDRPTGAYHWWHSGDDLAYSLGSAAESPDGTSWTAMGKDFSFRVYGFVQPAFSFSATVSNASLRPAESALFGVNFTNAGPGTSPALWVNVSLPAELSYTNDDAATVGGVRSGAYTFAFTNVAPGSHSFNLTAMARGGIADGRVAVTRFVFDAVDHNNAPLTQSTHYVDVTFKNANLALSFVPTPPDVQPSDLIAINASVTNVGSASARNVVVEGLVDLNATYRSSVPVGAYNPSARTIRWDVPVLGPGTSMNVSWSVEVLRGIPDLATVTSRGRVRYEDLTGTPLPPQEISVEARVHAPAFVTALVLDRTNAERGTELVAALHYNNTGSATSPWAWINWSLGGHYELVALSPSLTYVATSDFFSIGLTNVSSGPHAVAARLRVIRGMVDGLAMGLQVAFEARDGNGNLLPQASQASAVDLRAPSVALALGTAAGRVEVASIFVLNLTIQNVGRASATGWLNLTLPSGVAYVSDNGTFPMASVANGVTWTLPSLSPGPPLVLGIALRVEGESRTGSFRFALDFTDGKGSPPASIVSNAVAVEFVGASPGIPVWLWGLLAGGIGLPSFLVVRSRGKVEEVFLVNYGGLLMAHLSRTVKADRDRDIVTAMLTAVQDFIREAFVRSTEGELRRMDFGERKIMIHRGAQSYLAVVVSGRPPWGLPRRMVETLADIEGILPAVPQDRGVDRGSLGEISEALSRQLLAR